MFTFDQFVLVFVFVFVSDLLFSLFLDWFVVVLYDKESANGYDSFPRRHRNSGAL